MDVRCRRRAALIAPPVLIATTYLAFQGATTMLGERWGYLSGFVFFWVVWCGAFPAWAIGIRGIGAAFHSTKPCLPRPASLWLLLLAVPVVGGLITQLLPAVGGATAAVLLVAWVIAVVNGTAEEVLWRAVYVQLFPGQLVAGWLYPAAMFAVWHVSPTSVRGSAAVLVAGAAYIGLVLGWVALRTGSIRVTVPAHILVNGMGLSFALLLLEG